MKDSESCSTISHQGIVEKADNKSASIIISSSSACSGCHSEGSCSLSGKKDKIVVVKGSYKVNPGDSVTIVMKQSMGYTAMTLGYLLPLISLVLVLVVLISLKVPELVAGLISISALIPYYIVLYLFRERINEKFTFTLKA